VSRKVCIGVLAVAPAPLMWSLFACIGDPGIEVSLPTARCWCRCVCGTPPDRTPARPVFVEALAAAVGLRASRLGAAVVDVLTRQVELVFVRLGGAAEFRAAVGQHAAELDVVLAKNGTTRSLSRSAAVIGSLRSYSLANTTFEKVSMKVCW